MPAPVIVYMYGPAGCGKSKTLYEVFGCVFGTIVTKNITITLIDNFSGDGEPSKNMTDYVVLASNLEPDDIPIHMDHIFCLNSAEAVSECKSFLLSICDK